MQDYMDNTVFPQGICKYNGNSYNFATTSDNQAIFMPILRIIDHF